MNNKAFKLLEELLFSIGMSSTNTDIDEIYFTSEERDNLKRIFNSYIEIKKEKRLQLKELPDKTGWYRAKGIGEEYILFITVDKYDLWATRSYTSPTFHGVEVETTVYHRYRYQDGDGWESDNRNQHIFPREFEFLGDKR